MTYYITTAIQDLINHIREFKPEEYDLFLKAPEEFTLIIAPVQFAVLGRYVDGFTYFPHTSNGVKYKGMHVEVSEESEFKFMGVRLIKTKSREEVYEINAHFRFPF